MVFSFFISLLCWFPNFLLVVHFFFCFLSPLFFDGFVFIHFRRVRHVQEIHQSKLIAVCIRQSDLKDTQ
jgi:hypothetical protein